MIEFIPLPSDYNELDTREQIKLINQDTIAIESLYHLRLLLKGRDIYVTPAFTDTEIKVAKKDAIDFLTPYVNSDSQQADLTVRYWARGSSSVHIHFSQ